MSYVDVPTSSRHILIRRASGLPWPGGGGEVEDVGGAALLTGETDGFATDFTHAIDAERVAVKTAGTVVSSGLDSFFSNSGTSPKQVFDVSGNLVWSPHNMVLQSENFTASWTVSGTPIVTAHTIQDDDGATGEYIVCPSIATVIGQNYIVAAWFLKDAVTSRFPALYVVSSSGCATMLNTSTGAIADALAVLPLTSAVADEGTHWKLTITFAAGSSSTLVRLYPAYGTVMGTVGAAAVGTVTVDKVQVNRGSTLTAYLPTTSAARNGLAVDYDPVTHAAKGLLCEPAATNLLLNNATLSTQSVTVTAVAHTLSFWGTGTITLTGVSTAGPLVGTGASNRVSLTFTPTAGSLTCTVSGTVSRAQLEIGTIATSPIPTFAATATRTVDNVTFQTSTIPWSAAGANSILFTSASRIINASTYLHGHNATDDTERYLVDTSSGSRQARVLVTDNNILQADLSTVATPVVDTYYKVGIAADTNDLAIVVNGGTAAVDTIGTLPTITMFTVGGLRTPATSTARNVYTKTLTIVPRRMTNVELQTKTAA